MKRIYIAGECPGHPFLNFLDPPLVLLQNTQCEQVILYSLFSAKQVFARQSKVIPREVVTNGRKVAISRSYEETGTP